MSWNYRVMRHEDDAGDAAYIIHEVQYEGGEVSSWTEDGANVIADTRRGLFEILAMISEGIALPVLDYKTGNEIEPAIELGDGLKRVIGEIRAE